MDRAARQRIASRFDGHFQRGYVRGKLGSDPAYAAVAAAIAGSTLPLLDIGCGLGLLGHYLHESGHRQAYLGVDHDPRKIAAGRVAVQRAGLGHHVQLQQTDAADLPPLQGHVVLLDVLHYLPAPRQAALLAEASLHLAPAGCLVIRNVLREANWRFHVTRVEEFFLHASGWIRGGSQHYPDAGEVRAPLVRDGLQVTIEPLHGRTPFNSYLIVARRPA